MDALVNYERGLKVFLGSKNSCLFGKNLDQMIDEAFFPEDPCRTSTFSLNLGSKRKRMDRRDGKHIARFCCSRKEKTLFRSRPVA